MPLPSFRASLRIKLILCLLFTSLVSTAIMGGLAYRRLLDKFDDMTMHDSVARFSGDVAQYFRTYGTWENGLQHESFFSFTQRRRAVMLSSRRGLEGPAQGIRPGEPGLPADEAPPGGARPRGGYPGSYPGGFPGGLPGGVPGGGPDRDDAMSPLPRGDPRDLRDGPGRPGGPSGRGMEPARLSMPPFRFYLFDANHRSLVRLDPYGLGDEVRDEDRGHLRAVKYGGRVVAYFSPQGEVNYSDLDLGYLAAMRESLVLGVVAGTVLTLLLGLLLGNYLSRALRQLTEAAQAMGRGEWRQQVVVHSNDEVGVLATAFNRMSRDLADQYEELRASNERIEDMAGQLREQSVRDALTGLYNRRHFDEQCVPLFQRARRHERPLSLVMADIDHFKRINDQYSHAVGDEVLRRVGDILGTTMRGTDLVARYGGEEFALALPETDAVQAVEACEALRLRIESHPWADVYPGLQVTMSMGIASDTGVVDFHAMLADADRCLYQAKDGGRNRVASGAAAAAVAP